MTTHAIFLNNWDLATWGRREYNPLKQFYFWRVWD